jgi:glycerol transport system ATP-binding protein
MAGLDRPTRGRLLIDGKDVTGIGVRKRSIAMVYQQFINYPSLNVYNNIASPLKLAGISKAEIDRRVRQTASMLHLEGLLDRLPAELSGGQQQRTAIARALANDPSLLIADEPTGNLDSRTAESVLGLFAELVADGKTVAMVTHERDVARVASRIVTLADGVIVSDTGMGTHSGHSRQPEVAHA